MAEYQSFPELVAKCVDRLVESGVAALGGLYDLTSQRLVRYAATITRNQHDAEDAVQAALVQVARRLNRFCKADQPWPYLLRMVRNEALLIARRRERWRSSPYLFDLRTVQLVDEVELQETYRAIWSALRSLPTSQAEVVVLKIWEGMTFAEIAKILDLSPDTAASRYRYAMQKLNRKLAPMEGKVQRA